MIKLKKENLEDGTYRVWGAIVTLAAAIILSALSGFAWYSIEAIVLLQMYVTSAGLFGFGVYKHVKLKSDQTNIDGYTSEKG